MWTRKLEAFGADARELVALVTDGSCRDHADTAHHSNVERRFLATSGSA